MVVDPAAHRRCAPADIGDDLALLLCELRVDAPSLVQMLAASHAR